MRATTTLVAALVSNPAAWVVAMMLTGCAGDKDQETAETSDTGPTVDTTDTTDTTDTSDTTTSSSATGLFDGTVIGPQGPLVDAQLRFCRGQLCRNGVTDTSGAFVFANVPEAWHSFEVLPPTGSGLATVFVPLAFADGEHRSVSLTALPHDPPSPLGDTPEEHAVGTGLFLTVGLGQLEPPLFADEATAVTGVRVPEESWVPVDQVTGTVLAQWFVGPFDYHALPAEGLPIRIADEWGLPDGSSNYRVYVGSYEDSAWLDAGQATLSGGFFTGPALPLLSTVILVQE